MIGGHRKQLHDLGISTPFTECTLENPIEVINNLSRQELGAELTIRVDKHLAFITELSGAVIHSRTQLKAADCLGNASAICSACTDGFYATAVEDSSKAIYYRVKGSMGDNVLLPLGQLSLIGFDGWDSDIAGVRNPTPENRAPTSVIYDDSFHYGLQAKLSLPIN